MRRFCLLILVVLPQVSDVYSDNADRARVRIVRDWAQTADPKALAFASSRLEAQAAAADFTGKTDLAFSRLAKNQLLDGKFLAYENVWGALKGKLVADPTDKMTVAKVNGFGVQLVTASYGTNCTVVVAASRGEGATVHYAKSHDADLGRPFRQLSGTTTIIQEVEPAEYVFKAFRAGKETGKTDTVACVSTRIPVKVVIAE